MSLASSHRSRTGAARGHAPLAPLLALAALLLALVTPGRAAAQDAPPPLPTKIATFTWDRLAWRMSIAYREVISDEVLKKLNSGIPTVIVHTAAIYESGGDAPVAITILKTCRIIYDVWDEIYTVDTTPYSTPSPRPVPTLSGVLTRCAQSDRVALIERARLKVGTAYLVQNRIEVNPVSPDLLARIKRWVSRPKGTTTVGAGDALFGSLVGLFVTEISNADVVFRFRTQPVVVPPPPPPPPPAASGKK